MLPAALKTRSQFDSVGRQAAEDRATYMCLSAALLSTPPTLRPITTHASICPTRVQENKIHTDSDTMTVHSSGTLRKVVIILARKFSNRLMMVSCCGSSLHEQQRQETKSQKWQQTKESELQTRTPFAGRLPSLGRTPAK